MNQVSRLNRQSMINNVMMLNGHKERADVLDLMAVAKDFSQANDRRRIFLNLNTLSIRCDVNAHVHLLVSQARRT